MKNRLDFLKRLRVGKTKLNHYKSLFIDFNDAKLIDLETSDSILNSINYTKTQTEIIDYTDDNFLKSILLKNIYLKIDDQSKAYIFTDDFQFCGLFLVNTKEALEKSLKIAKEDYNHTVFILESNNYFFIRINYYDTTHYDFPLKYDIRLSSNG